MRSPALANSTNSDGIVAETNTVCLDWNKKIFRESSWKKGEGKAEWIRKNGNENENENWARGKNLFSGKFCMISWICGAKPISNKRSASSNTMYSTALKLNPTWGRKEKWGKERAWSRKSFGSSSFQPVAFLLIYTSAIKWVNRPGVAMMTSGFISK